MQSGAINPFTLPPDVLFAQKASALVKAAGMNPRTLDLEKFRQMSHIICCRVFQVIFNDKPDGFVEVCQHQDDFVENIQLVISSLRDRIDDPSVLAEVSGQNICFGSHRSIAILVDVLYKEGQKVWKQRQEQRAHENAENDTSYSNQNTTSNNSNYNINNDSQENQIENAPYETPPPGDIPRSKVKQRPHSASNIRSSSKKKDKKNTNYYEDILVNDHQLWSDLRSPDEIRINELEQQLKDYEGIMLRQENRDSIIRNATHQSFNSNNPNPNPLIRGGSPNSKNRIANRKDKNYNINQKQTANQKGRVRVVEVIRAAHQFENFMEDARRNLDDGQFTPKFPNEIRNRGGDDLVLQDEDPNINRPLRRPSSAPSSRKVSKVSERLYNPHQGTKARNALATLVARFNRANIMMSLGQGYCSDNYYCSRELGRHAIPGSETGVCGPFDGPQCPDCKGFTLSEFNKIASSSANNAENIAKNAKRHDSRRTDSSDDERKKNLYNDNTQYTYDINGRRITMQDYQEIQRKKQELQRKQMIPRYNRENIQIFPGAGESRDLLYCGRRMLDFLEKEKIAAVMSGDEKSTYKVTCNHGHTCILASSNEYKWKACTFCETSEADSSTSLRWYCHACKFDACFSCRPDPACGPETGPQCPDCKGCTVSSFNDTRDPSPPKKNAYLSVSNSNSAPANPVYPNHTIERTSNKWIEQQREFIESHVPKHMPKAFVAGIINSAGNDNVFGGRPSNDISKPSSSSFSNARHYDFYQNLGKNEILVTVEHCHSCRSHSITTKHDPEAYASKANALLQHMAQYSYNLRLQCKFGVARFHINISDEKKGISSSDMKPSRIGAFEVQIAYRDRSNMLHTELLHSKLASMKWPANSVIDKRIQSFISKMNGLNPTNRGLQFIEQESPDSMGDVEVVSGSQDSTLGIADVNHPLGYVNWEDLDISNERWMFPSNCVNCVDIGPHYNLKVYWVFDQSALSGLANSSNSGDDRSNYNYEVQAQAQAQAHEVKPSERLTISTAHVHSNPISSPNPNSSPNLASNTSSRSNNRALSITPNTYSDAIGAPLSAKSGVEVLNHQTSKTKASNNNYENIKSPQMSTKSPKSAPAAASPAAPAHVEDSKSPRGNLLSPSEKNVDENKTIGFGAVEVAVVNSPKPSFEKVNVFEKSILLGLLSNLKENLNAADDPDDLNWDMELPLSEWQCLTSKSKESGDIALESIQLSYIKLNREIPVNICKLHSLMEIKLQNCMLTGGILSEFSELVNLMSLNLSKNKLIGTLPVALSGLVYLQRLDVSDNALNGKIPIEYSKFASVEIMSFQGNNLEGPIDPKIIKAKKLIKFECDMIPYIDKSNIPFADKPKIHNFIGAMQSFDFKPLLQADSASATQDKLLTLYNKYKDVSESECDFDAFAEWGNPDIRKWNGIHVSSDGSLESLVLRSYKLSKNFPAVISVGFNCLNYLDMSDNMLSGDMPDSWASFNCLQHLHLDNNALTSSNLDDILPRFIDLRTINISNNQFAGPLPPRLGELLYLEEAFLDRNNFSGNLPAEYGGLVNLRVFNLSHNKLSGSIPSEYSDLQDLQLFDLTGNKLTPDSAIPSSIAKVTKI